MRRIDSKWKELHEGYRTIRKHQQEINLKWARALKVTYKRIYQREYQKWMDQLTFEKKRFRTITIIFLILTLVTTLCAGISSIFSLAFGLAFLSWGTVLFILMTLIGLMAIQKLVINNHEKKQPIHSNNNKGISDLEAAWWNHLKPPPIQIIEFGDEGEKKFLDIMEGKLPHNWIALHQYKTRKNLDADILVLGSNGIWLFESKYNSGAITCRNGEWIHDKRYYAEGGKEVTERKTKRPYDQQWLAEKNSIVETIMRRAPKDVRWIANEIRGGIVFTHEDITLNIDQSCKVEYGTISYWAKKITNSPKISNLTVDVLLQVVEAISEYANQLSENVDQKSANQLALAIYNKKDQKEIPEFIRGNI